jgi:predicted secreted hydrolase
LASLNRPTQKKGKTMGHNTEPHLSWLSAGTSRRRLLGGSLALGTLALAGTPALAATAATSTGGTRRFVSGVPLFVDTTRDLPLHAGSALESWYVNAAFESRGKTIGFEWHQGITPLGSSTEFLLMNATDGVWRPQVVAEPLSATVGAEEARCHVYSSLGILEGDRAELRLKAGSGRDSLDVVLTPQPQELYNGTTGLLHLLGSDSYEYAFPNMQARGTVTIDGETFPVDTNAVWFDRQWGKAELETPEVLQQKAEIIAQSHWTWLGLAFGPGNRSAISFWDIMEPTIRWTALTYLRADGIQMNVGAKVDYDQIWTSTETGQRYPASAHITAPAIGLDITLSALLDKPEFVYAPGQGHSGSQSLCQAAGKIDGMEIDQPAILELIGGIDV